MLNVGQSRSLEEGMRRIAEYANQQAIAQHIGPIRLSWSKFPTQDQASNRIVLKIVSGSTSREVTLNREPVEEYGKLVDSPMMEAVIRELVRRLTEKHVP